MKNIVIHITDSSAHGSSFSDYDNNDEDEKLLINALKECREKNIYFIGLMMDIFSRKSFFKCKEIYEDGLNKKNYNSGYYDIIDFTMNKNNFVEVVEEKVNDILLNRHNKIYLCNDNCYNYIKENNFKFDIYDVKMKFIHEIKQYKNK